MVSGTATILIAYDTRFGINSVIDFGAFGFHFGFMLAPFFLGACWGCLGSNPKKNRRKEKAVVSKMVFGTAKFL